LPPSDPIDPFIAETQEWVQRVVVGLNLCPFAAAAVLKNQIRYTICDATDPDQLLEVLRQELQHLASKPPEELETTLIIHPHVLQEFADYNQFLAEAEEAVEMLGYSGTLQVASFHPAYQFADTEPDDITNATNQSPYPTLHILREESIERGLENFPNPSAIYEANKATLGKLGHQGWSLLRDLCRKSVKNQAVHPQPGNPPQDSDPHPGSG
jgi:hypothetical protein